MEAQFAVEDLLNRPIDALIQNIAFRKVVRGILWAGVRTFDEKFTIADAGKFMSDWSEKHGGLSSLTETLMEAVLDATGNYTSGEIKRILAVNKAELRAKRKAAMEGLDAMEATYKNILEEPGEPPGTGEKQSEPGSVS